MVTSHCCGRQPFRDGECHAGVERREGPGDAERAELRDVAGTVSGINIRPQSVWNGAPKPR